MRAGKRRKSVISEDKPNLINSGSEDENNDNNDDRLPVMPSQIRESRRARKRLKGFENYKIRIN